MSRRLLTLVAAAVLLLGCTEKQAGGGEETDACWGYLEFGYLGQPPPDSVDKVREFGEVFLRILSRIDVDRRVKDRDGHLFDVPPEVKQAYGTLEESLRRFRDRTRAATNAAEVRAAVNELDDDEAFSRADRVIADFHRTSCGTEE